MRNLLLYSLWFTMFLSTGLLWSCSDRMASQDEQWEGLFGDIMLVNASVGMRHDTILPHAVYTDVYRRWGVDSSHVDSLLVYFSEHPEAFATLLDRVITHLQREYDKLEVEETPLRDSLELKPVSLN